MKPEHSVQTTQMNTGSGECANRTKTTGEFAKCDGVRDPETGKCGKCKGEWLGQGSRVQNSKNPHVCVGGCVATLPAPKS